MTRHRAGTLVLALLTTAIGGSALADAERADLLVRQKQLNSLIQNLQTDLVAKVATRDQAERDTRDLAREVARGARRIARLRQQQRNDEAALQRLEHRRLTLGGEIAQQRARLASQLRAAYLTGRMDAVKVLFNQQNPAQVGRMLKYFDYYHAQTTDEVHRLQDEVRDAAGVETAITQHKDDIARRLAVLQQERTTLDRQLEQRRESLIKYNTQVQAQGAQLAHAREDAQQLEKLLKSLNDALNAAPASVRQPGVAMAHAKGRLRWPLQGQVLAEFGRPRNDGGLKWSGLFIAAPEGMAVESVADGRVVFGDWMPGYGLVLIVDHGQGFLSLYAYNQTLTKEAGDQVVAGDVIATVGRGAVRDVTGLYFEIRRDGKPADPRGWLAARGH